MPTSFNFQRNLPIKDPEPLGSGACNFLDVENSIQVPAPSLWRSNMEFDIILKYDIAMISNRYLTSSKLYT